MGESLEISEVFVVNMITLMFRYQHNIFQWSSKSRARWFMTGLLHVLSMLLVILTAPFSLFFSLKRCQEYERAVVLGSTLERVCEKIVDWCKVSICRLQFVGQVWCLSCHFLSMQKLLTSEQKCLRSQVNKS